MTESLILELHLRENLNPKEIPIILAYLQKALKALMLNGQLCKARVDQTHH